MSLEKNQKNNSSVKKVILLFIFILLFLPFYDSKRVAIWESQRENIKENVFRSMVLSYANFSEELKEKLGIGHFFESEHFFWLKLKKSPIVFQESEKTPTSTNEKSKIKKENKAKESEKVIENINERNKRKVEEGHKMIVKESLSQKEKTKKSTIKLNPPYRILIIGDSFMAVGGGLGDPLERALLKYENVKVFRLGRVSSGLSRPDYFNWELTLQELISQKKPNVLLVMLGLNDAQAITNSKGKAIVNFSQFGKEKWREEYKKRVSNLLNIARENKIVVFWIGIPIVKNKELSQKMDILNSIYKKTAQDYENCYFISTRDLLTDEKGNYISYLKDEKGIKRLIRSSDGIHLTYFGGRIVVKGIVEKIEKILQLKPRQ